MTSGKPKHSAALTVLTAVCAVLMVLMLILGLGSILRSLYIHRGAGDSSASEAVTPIETTAAPETTTVITTTTTTDRFHSAPVPTNETVTVTDTALLIARNALLLHEAADGSSVILAQRDADTRTFPASLTKVMTMVTFFELVPEADLDNTVTVLPEVITAQRERQLHVTGFYGGEQVTVRDLLHAMMLTSGADAAVMLAVYAAGSEETFVGEMNALAADMGLADTHFTNCTGVHDENHYTTLSDFSRIFLYALDHQVCRTLMSTKRYTTSATAEHPEGIDVLSTTLYRMNGDELETLPDPLHIIGGKTGFTLPAGQCLATWAENASGDRYVCIVTGSTERRSMDAVSDTLTLYQLTQRPAEGLTRYVLTEADILDPPPYF